MQRKSPTWLRVHRETALDVWVKRIGVAKEIQTGDPTFDARAYVTYDHPSSELALTRSKELRDAIAAARALEGVPVSVRERLRACCASCDCPRRGTLVLDIDHGSTYLSLAFSRAVRDSVVLPALWW